MRKVPGKYMYLLTILSAILFCSSVIMWTITNFTNDIGMLFFVVQFLWLSNMCYGFAKLRTRFIFTVFHMTFFLFVLGRIIINWLFYGSYSLDYTLSIMCKVYQLIALSLITLRISSIIFEKFRVSIHSNKKVKLVDYKINKIYFRKAAKILFWASFPFAIVYILEKVFFVKTYGYASYYVEYISVLPNIFAKLFTINEIAIFAFLGSEPSKEEIKWPVLAYILVGILCLGYGQRNPIALRICTIFLIYYPLRELYTVKKGEWINKKFKLLLIISIPTLILFFSFWGYYRASSSTESIGNMFTNFFNSQGNSSRILAETISHISDFPQYKNYTFGSLIDFSTNNFIYNILFGKTMVYSGFTVEAALNGNNFGNAISYLYDSYHYLLGIGLGSCYIAELFVDYGYVGVIVINAIYAYFMVKIPIAYSKNIIFSVVSLLFAYKIIYAPRDSALAFISTVLSFTFILSVVILYLLYIILKKYTNNEEAN